MQAVTLGLSPNFTDFSSDYLNTAPASAMSGPLPPNMGMDPLQLQQLMQLLASGKPQPQVFVPPTPAAAAAAPKQTAVVECPKSMVGRVIGKGGETIKALQQYTGAMIQIDQSTDPTRVTIAGSAQSLQLAVSMVSDIVRGTFKGFAMLRQIAMATGLGPFAQPQPVYVQGYGFVPPSQVFAPGEEGMAGGAGGPMLRSPPSGPLTPPITPLRANDANNLAGTLPPETLAALLGGNMNQSMLPSPPLAPPPAANTSSQDALIAQLLNQLVFNNQQQQQQPAPMRMEAPRMGQSGLDQGALQAFLAQSGVFNSSSGGAGAGGSSHQQMMSSMPPSASLMRSAQGTPAVFTQEHGQYGADFANTLGSFGSSGGGSAHHSSGTASPSHSLNGAPSSGAQLDTSPPHSSPVLGSGFTSLSSAASPQLARRPTSGESSPLGRYGAIGCRKTGTSAPGSVDGNAGNAVGSPGYGSPVMSPNLWANN